MCMRSLIHRAVKHQSCRAVESLAASPRRTRVTSVVMRRKTTSCMGQSPKLVAKHPLRSRSKRVCIGVHALLGPAQHVAVKEMLTRHLAVIRVTRSQRNVARSCIRSRIISAWHGGVWFLSISQYFIVNKVHCEPFVGSSCLFCILVHCVTGMVCVVCFVSVGVKSSK